MSQLNDLESFVDSLKHQGTISCDYCKHSDQEEPWGDSWDGAFQTVCLHPQIEKFETLCDEICGKVTDGLNGHCPFFENCGDF